MASVEACGIVVIVLYYYIDAVWLMDGAAGCVYFLEAQLSLEYNRIIFVDFVDL